MAATSSMSYQDSLSSQYLSSSISSLSSQRAQTSSLARTYRQAAQLFLTRRLYEALTTIEPLISTVSDDEGHDSDSLTANANGRIHDRAAPVATASKTTRVKVWSFYLTLLNSIIDLGPEEGKLVFGTSKWRALAAKAREGSVWDEVVRLGYANNEGAVDGEVVVNLATLLLTHMPSQALNQQKLETYLSASSNPTYDIAAHMDASQTSQPKHNAGTSTPRDLNTRLKLLELYTLHVLPQNAEWDYARDFINMSEVLDDERRDAFQFALQSLKEEKDHDAIREAELRRRQEDDMEQRRADEEKRRQDEARQVEERKQREAEDMQRPSTSRSNHSNNPLPRPAAAASSSQSKSPPDANGPSRKPPPAKGRGPAKRPPSSSSASIFHRATSVLALMQTTILNARQSLTNNPMAMVRFLLFLLAFFIAFARRDVRERIRRTTGDAWDRLRRTIGMGVKVSYI